MKSILSLFLISCLCAFDCNKDKDLPTCIQQRIKEIASQPKWNPPATINEFIYKGKHVYGISSDCCDQYNILVDENCNYICAPSGGITGKGDGKCADFADSAKFVKQVWKDPR